ncbi:PEP-CTERM sorting domain-containing protein [Coraliomargarita parva]|uniref:PEP-CTERM sorting domain-containing protein n=1 Tax=Coraliomargarita parva TaxID=3014050 RepID=UPI0022B39A62|nr:PEP-CTERM sorting domain-containing protein [Coraliomargarita parva]
MKIVTTALISSSTLLLGLNSAQAVLLAYDGFEDYDTSSTFETLTSSNGGTGWTDSFATTQTNTGFVSGARNIDYNSGAIQIDGGTRSLFSTYTNSSMSIDRSWSTGVDLSAGSGNALYVSFLWQTRTGDTSAESDGTNPGFFQVTVGEGAGDTTYGVINRQNTGLDPVDWQWQARYANSSNTTDGPTSVVDDVYFVVMKIESGLTSVFINPTSTTEGTPTITESGNQLDSSWDAVDSITIRQALGSTNWNFDELRIATTYEEAVAVSVPEPATYASILAGLCLSLAAIRRRRK